MVDMRRLKYWNMNMTERTASTAVFDVTGEEPGFCIHWTEAAGRPTVEDITGWLQWTLESCA